MDELIIEATAENVDCVIEFVEEHLLKEGCPTKAVMQMSVAVDELFGNIARYAYNPEVGIATVRVEVHKDPFEVIVTFLDHGKRYNPLAAADPDTTLSAKDREIGGLGVFIVKKTMDDVSYEYKDGQNILRIRKSL